MYFFGIHENFKEITYHLEICLQLNISWWTEIS